MTNKAAVQHDRHVASTPSLEDIFDHGCIERSADDPVAGKPSANTHNPSGCLGRTRDGIGNGTEMDRLTLDQTYYHPRPYGKSFVVHLWVNRLKLRLDTLVELLA